MTGEQIRGYRKSANISQTQLAEELTSALNKKFTTSLISYIESGVVDAPEKVKSYLASKTAEKPFRNPSVASKGSGSINVSPEGVSLFKSSVLPEAKRLTQEDRVLEYIQEFGSITTWDAFADLGITRLSAKIFDLDKEGYKFDRTIEHAMNRYGKPVHYTRYSLRKDDGEKDLD